MFLNSSDLFDDAPSGTAPHNAQRSASHNPYDAGNGFSVPSRHSVGMDPPTLDDDSGFSPQRQAFSPARADAYARPYTGASAHSTHSVQSNNSSGSQQSTTPSARRARLKQMRQKQRAKRKSKMQSTGMVRADAVPTGTGPAFVSNAGSQQSIQSSASSVSADFNSPPFPQSTSPPPTSPQNSQDISQLLQERREQSTTQNATTTMSAVERELVARGIRGVFDPVKRQPAEVKLDFSDMRAFLTNPLPKGHTLQCNITRRKGGVLKGMRYPVYELRTNDDVFLMAARKRAMKKTSNYLLSMDADDMDKGSASYLGKVRSNMWGTEFMVYDKGTNPADVAPTARSVSMMSVRQELAAVLYESNILGSRGPRKMTVLVPHVGPNGVRQTFRPLAKSEAGILDQYKTGNLKGLVSLTNKTPKWNEQIGAYVLNFNGRVTMASVKNFQLVDQDFPDNITLQFGRTAKDCFTMDFQWPLSPLQAFGIVMSSFDYKIACE